MYNGTLEILNVLLKRIFVQWSFKELVNEYKNNNFDQCLDLAKVEWCENLH